MTRHVVRRGGLHELYLQPDGSWGPYETAKRFTSQGAACADHARRFPGSEDFGVFPCSVTSPPAPPSEVRAYKAWARGAGLRVFRVTLGKRSATIAAETKLDARSSVLREWFGLGVFWEEEDGRGRVVEQKLVKRRGVERFRETPLTRWGKLTIKEVRRG